MTTHNSNHIRRKGKTSNKVITQCMQSNPSGYESFLSRALVLGEEDSLVLPTLRPSTGGGEGETGSNSAVVMANGIGRTSNISNISISATSLSVDSHESQKTFDPLPENVQAVDTSSTEQNSNLSTQQGDARSKALHRLEQVSHTAVVANDFLYLLMTLNTTSKERDGNREETNDAKQTNSDDNNQGHGNECSNKELRQHSSPLATTIETDENDENETDEDDMVQPPKAQQTTIQPSFSQERGIAPVATANDDKNTILPPTATKSTIDHDSLPCSKTANNVPNSTNIPTDIATTHPRNAGQYTIIAFVNSTSGGGMGNSLYTTLQSHLGPSYVIDLHSCRHPGQMPQDTLIKYAHDPMVRILACGGDGTMGWIYSSLDKVWSTILGQSSPMIQLHLSPFKNHLPLAVVPLGTGNDLSRQFGWGGTFQESMRKRQMILDAQNARITSLDRWRCTIMPVTTIGEEEKKFIPKILGESIHTNGQENATEELKRRKTYDTLKLLLEEDSSSSNSKKWFSSRHSSKKKQTISSSSQLSNTQFFDGVFCNYFSLGFDAKIAHLFHCERENHPEKFTSPLKNKLIYVQKSPSALRAPKLRKRVRMFVNNEKGELVKLKIPKNCRAIATMNIQSYAGGNQITTKGSSTDGLMEVIFVSNIIRAVTSMSVGPVMPFVLFKVAAQTNKVCIRTLCPLHCQVDGEPWLQGEGVIQIKFHSRNAILEKNDDGLDCGCWGSSGDNDMTSSQ